MISIIRTYRGAVEYSMLRIRSVVYFITAVLGEIPHNRVLNQRFLVVYYSIARIVVVLHERWRLRRLKFRQLLLLDDHIELV